MYIYYQLFDIQSTYRQIDENHACSVASVSKKAGKEDEEVIHIRKKKVIHVATKTKQILQLFIVDVKTFLWINFKKGRYEVVFPSRSKKDLFFDKT